MKTRYLMKTKYQYPAHHHDPIPGNQRCAVCGYPGVAAYMVEGGRAITMKVIRRRFRPRFRFR